jgi:hypothetical protein
MSDVANLSSHRPLGDGSRSRRRARNRRIRFSSGRSAAAGLDAWEFLGLGTSSRYLTDGVRPGVLLPEAISPAPISPGGPLLQRCRPHEGQGGKASEVIRVSLRGCQLQWYWL